MNIKTKTAIKKDIAETKAQLKKRRSECKECSSIECGYCAVRKWNLEQRIERLTKQLAPGAA